MLATLVAQLSLQRTITRLTEDELRDTSESIELAASYSHGEMEPLFRIPMIGDFSGNFSGAHNNVSDILLVQQSKLQSVFGVCRGATIRNIGFTNVTLQHNNDGFSKNSIVCSDAVNTAFVGIYIELSGKISTSSNFSLICHTCSNITVENVKISGFGVDITGVQNMGAFVKISQSRITDVEINIQLNILNVTTVALLAIDSQNNAYNQVSVASTHQIFNNTYYSLLFATTTNDIIKNTLFSQNIIFYAIPNQNILIGSSITSLTMSQTQFATVANEPFTADMSNVVYNTTAQYYMTVHGADDIKIDAYNQSALEEFYAGFNQTELESIYFLNTDGLYLLTLGDPFLIVDDRTLCSSNADCGGRGVCAYTQKGISRLGIIVRMYYCRCQDGYYGQACQNQVSMVNGRCQDGYTGRYCTMCALSHANVGGVCRPNCILHGGYTADGSGCSQCQQNYTGPYCSTCASGYLMIQSTCRRDSGGCQFNSVTGQCTSCSLNNYTGSFCDQCATDYTYDPTTQLCIYNMNRVCALHGGFNTSSQACRNCSGQLSGQLCLNNQTDPGVLCLMHGGSDAGRCRQCQPGYTGALCSACDRGYLRKGDLCVPQQECIDAIFDANCTLQVDCTAHGGIDYNLQQCRQCSSPLLEQPFCTSCKHHYIMGDQGQCVCHGNYTGANCQECSNGYYKYREGSETTYGCYYDNRSACLPQPYDPLNEKCRYCALGQFGRYCENCREFASGQNCGTIDYVQLCQQHGGLSSAGNSCVQCQRNYTGALCDQCAGTYMPDTQNRLCVQNDSTLCNIFFGYDRGQCTQCVYNRTGATCQECTVNNIRDSFDQCKIDQYDPNNGIEAAIDLACSVHGGVTEYNTCRFCQYGFSGPFCRECGPGYVQFNKTKCVINNTAVCEQYGGWNIANNTCNNCQLSNSYTLGDLCDTCVNGSFYYSQQQRRCSTIESYSNANREREDRGLRIACIVVGVVCIILLIAMIVVIVLYCNYIKQQEQSRSAYQSTIRNDHQIMTAAKVKSNSPTTLDKQQIGASSGDYRKWQGRLSAEKQ